MVSMQATYLVESLLPKSAVNTHSSGAGGEGWGFLLLQSLVKLLKFFDKLSPGRDACSWQGWSNPLEEIWAWVRFQTPPFGIAVQSRGRISCQRELSMSEVNIWGFLLASWPIQSLIRRKTLHFRFFSFPPLPQTAGSVLTSENYSFVLTTVCFPDVP